MKAIQNVSKDCFAHQKYVLSVFGFSTNTGFVKKLYAITLLIILTIYPFAVIIEIVNLNNNFDQLILNVMFEIAYITGLICGYCLYWNKSSLHKLFDKMQVLGELAKFVNGNDDYLLIQNCENFVIKLGSGGPIYLYVPVMGSSIFVATILSIQNKEWTLPFGSGIFIQNGAIQFFLQIFTYCVNILLNYFALFMYISMLILVSAHCQHLQKYIRSIIKVTQRNESLKTDNQQNANITWKTFKIELKKVVDYHTTINETASVIEKIYCFFIFSWFGGISLCICCLMYHGLTLPAGDVNILKEFMFIVIAYTLLLTIAYWGDQVQTESSKILSACYEVEFVGLDLRIQKSLLLIQMQRPIKLTIGKIKNLDLPTMVAVFQSIYSYYAFLRTMKNAY
nr:odorant receptor 41 [Podabrus annulatus]